MRNAKLFIAALALALPLSAFAGGQVYVQSAKAKVVAEPSFSAPVVAQAIRGDAMEVLESKERWHKVKYGGKSGWISKLLVSEHAPLNKNTALDDTAAAGTELSGRRRASAATTAGAARGLTYDERARASQAGIANYGALEKVEQFSVDEKEALAFVAEGLKQ